MTIIAILYILIKSLHYFIKPKKYATRSIIAKIIMKIIISSDDFVCRSKLSYDVELI